MKLEIKPRSRWKNKENAIIEVLGIAEFGGTQLVVYFPVSKPEKLFGILYGAWETLELKRLDQIKLMDLQKRTKGLNLDNVPEPSWLTWKWWNFLEWWERNWLGRRLSHLWYWIRCHTYTCYHIVDCRSPQNDYSWGYLEPSELIWYAAFNLLKNFVEIQMYSSYVVWDPEIEKEIIEIYTWWIKGRQEEHEEFSKLESGLSDSKDLSKAFFNIEDENKWSFWKKRHDELDSKDDEMLLRLIKIRHNLWTQI